MLTREKSDVFPTATDSFKFARSRARNSNDPSRQRYAAHPSSSTAKLTANALNPDRRVRRSQTSVSATPIPSCGFSASAAPSKPHALQSSVSTASSRSSTQAIAAKAVNISAGFAKISVERMGRQTSPATSIKPVGPAPIRIRHAISAQATPNSAPDTPSNSIDPAGHPTRTNGSTITIELGG